MRKHGGHIGVASEPGKGTTFEVFLPASEVGVSPLDGEAVAVARGEGRILVMDDEDHVRDVAREILEELGYSVEAVATGDEAVHVYAQAQASHRPSGAVILDLPSLEGPAGSPCYRDCGRSTRAFGRSPRVAIRETR